MRVLLILLATLAMALFINKWAGGYGGTFMLLVLLISLGIPYPLSAFKSARYKRRINKWLEQAGLQLKNVEPRAHRFRSGKLFWKSTDAQLVFSVKSGNSEYWFACGSWWLGVYSNKISIYQYIDRKLVFFERISA
ncbi:hypothetical protein ACONUD_02730 [Microbulbifer harenosus]|uniref:Spore germination protein n=1 Tax=Microbulbifer harenosus TaxID=2576840 RepID=A0ABY2UHY3_9GAMM|nr:spore germination protein [Microbulbifer harenosus]TLM73429.1 spore germination protein [Microbulbifer harenosus]